MAADLGPAVSLLQNIHTVFLIDLRAENAPTKLLWFRNMLRVQELVVGFTSRRSSLGVKHGFNASFGI